MTVEVGDAQVVRGADGLLGAFNQVGVLAAADVHVATRLGRLGGEAREPVLLAAALAVRAARLGSVCLDIAEVRATTAVEGESLDDLAWPETGSWLAALEASELVASDDTDTDGGARPLRLVDGVLYLARYWRDEQVVALAVDTATARTAPSIDSERMGTALARLFGSEQADRQRLAAVVAATRWFSVIAGGPGTGKTTTVARLVALLRDQAGPPLRIALAAPTGRAAARLGEAVAAATGALDPADRERISSLEASTLHRLLGWKPGSRTRFRHDATNPLPYDVVIVDEASMVSLTMMARLVDALREDTRLVLVGDPDQLASVEVGAVLGDLVRRAAPVGESTAIESLVPVDLESLDADERHSALASGVVRLSHVYRFAGEIEQLAQGVRAGDADAVLALLDTDAQTVELVETGSGALRTDVVSTGHEVVRAARAGDGDAAVEALARHRLLCAHREGPHGVGRWSVQAEEWLRAEIEGYGHEGFAYVGRPLLVTANDYQLRLFNGDTGVVVDVDGEPRAAFRRDGRVETLPTGRLGEVQTMHAMSVHRSQGSQFDRVTLVLPPADSPLLTRELLYTAVTRATEHVRIIGTREALAQAVSRPIVRASGLRTHRS
ncbi:MAG: exodeoxyribonuclease V subunit alpha [Actinomycetia bacterium]|nr:exodeoxyribonuclease V subunit alpha [Actinomycetes bacterium]